MIAQALDPFLLGALAMGFAVAGVAFLRFWRRTRDTLFLLFAVAFFSEAVGRTVLALAGGPSEARPAVFLLRMLAYLFIVAGVVAKNLPRRAEPPDRSAS